MATISTPKILFDPASILSRPVMMKVKGSELDIKRGTIVEFDVADKAYEAVAPATLDYGTTPPKTRCAIALEDAHLTTKATAVKAIVAGTVYVNALRELGYNATRVSMDSFDVLGGLSNIRFVEEV